METANVATSSEKTGNNRAIVATENSPVNSVSREIVLFSLKMIKKTKEQQEVNADKAKVVQNFFLAPAG